MPAPTSPPSDEFIRARTTTVGLADGGTVTLRPVVPSDKALVVAGLEGLSPESRYRRFLRPIEQLTAAELEYLTELDYEDHFAWGALVATDQGPEGAGIARYVRLASDPTVAEAAVAVVDAHQSRGIGTLLLEVLVESAVANGVRAFRAYVGAWNDRVLHRLERLGARTEREGTAVRVEIDLGDVVDSFADSAVHEALRAAAQGTIPFAPVGLLPDAAPPAAALPDPYPLRFHPILMEKVWGGRRLRSLGKEVPEGIGIGESWEIADLATTAPSGGGGDAARSIVSAGPLAGATLQEVLARWGDRLVGPGWDVDDFPLLVKYLDAAEHLSVQVHPTPAYAATHPGSHLKSESWYVVDAEPGAVLFIGLRPGAGVPEVAAAVAEGRLPELLEPRPAVVGECHHLPSGTIHALGAGVVVAEVQTPSDTTFRLYDWTEEYGRPDRPLHVTEAMESLELAPPPPPTRADPAAAASLLVATPDFWIASLRPAAAPVTEGGGSASWRVLMTVAGTATIATAAGTVATVAGDTVLVPAVLVVGMELTGDGEVLAVGSGEPPGYTSVSRSQR